MDPSDFYGIYGMAELVCLDHISDAVLRNALDEELADGTCSYCGRESPDEGGQCIVSMNALGEKVWEAANWLYSWTENVDYIDGEPWSYEALYETSEVLYETVEDCIDPEYATRIIERLAEATNVADYWIASDHTSSLAFGWSAFAATVRTESRFVVVGRSDRPGYEDEPPARLASFLEALLTYVESDLLVELPEGSVLYRGRMAEDARHLYRRIVEEPSTELGPAPSHLAESGRLSPRGVSLFYSADDRETAVAEIALHSVYDQAVVGAFRTTKPLQILDFTRKLTSLPSVFATDEASRQRWTFAQFKKHFTDMIAAPVVLDGRQAVDYTPTQVVAEWLRWVPTTRIDGIAWPSHLADSVGEQPSEDDLFVQFEADSEEKKVGKNVVLFLGPGTEFQSDPPTATEMSRRSTPRAVLTLSKDDISLHKVTRAVSVLQLEEYEEEYW